MNRMLVTIGLLIGFGACASDETAQEACSNVTCPPGTAVNLTASSVEECQASFAASSSATDGSVAGEGGCFASGSCVYSCEALTDCCGAETWTDDSYTCDNPCNTGSECGNGVCEDGEVCTGSVCVQMEAAGEECSVCIDDCCTACGDGVCEYPETADCNDQKNFCQVDCDPDWTGPCEGPGGGGGGGGNGGGGGGGGGDLPDLECESGADCPPVAPACMNGICAKP